MKRPSQDSQIASNPKVADQGNMCLGIMSHKRAALEVSTRQPNTRFLPAVLDPPSRCPTHEKGKLIYEVGRSSGESKQRMVGGHLAAPIPQSPRGHLGLEPADGVPASSSWVSGLFLGLERWSGAAVASHRPYLYPSGVSLLPWTAQFQVPLILRQ